MPTLVASDHGHFCASTAVGGQPILSLGWGAVVRPLALTRASQVILSLSANPTKADFREHSEFGHYASEKWARPTDAEYGK